MVNRADLLHTEEKVSAVFFHSISQIQEFDTIIYETLEWDVFYSTIMSVV